ncbi:TcaA NTF2-like domain-containing protein [Domibacillus epiphyticus]|uniref:Zinc-ribbon domain-containing protein n=1 Tax=Domibacillus epiphyticus TaxID=1714355 RepID=A0A1V2A6P4_9BACI|nr:hypothetical protein [Domibacillus epiphyticus]OMP66659.1 hypothetical protein BTO28_11490 [Domibacillus epiphyticus]
MTCDKCGHVSPNGSRFCIKCGAPLHAPREKVGQEKPVRKGLWVGVAVLVVLLAVHFFLQQKYSPEAQIEQFEKTVLAKDKAQLKSFLKEKMPDVPRTDDIINEYFAYLDEQVDKDAMFSSLRANQEVTDRFGNKVAEMVPVKKTLGLYGGYDLKLNAVNVIVEPVYGEQTVSMSGKKLTLKEEEKPASIGTFLPGSYDAEIVVGDVKETITIDLAGAESNEMLIQPEVTIPEEEEPEVDFSIDEKADTVEEAVPTEADAEAFLREYVQTYVDVVNTGNTNLFDYRNVVDASGKSYNEIKRDARSIHDKGIREEFVSLWAEKFFHNSGNYYRVNARVTYVIGKANGSWEEKEFTEYYLLTWQDNQFYMHTIYDAEPQ